ncbi:MAG: tetratricopeptide repeat protein, partial [Eudoraea sp.]|nr:tetratricopeptide repeat protein [Eudoraea sp.]
MAKSLGRILLLISFFTFAEVVAQDMDIIENNALRNFQTAESPLDRFNYFFATVNRYGSHSPYDWLDSVKEYIDRVESADDSLALNQYKLIRAQLYFDLNDFNKSITIASEVYSEKHIFDLDAKRVLLNLMDDNYAQLQMYDKQVEIRKQKKGLGLTENIAFYDIYSSLGLHRQAMKDYIRDVKPTIEENAYFDQATYNNNIGNYLRLDKRASTALANFSKAKGYIDVWSNDMSEVKTESEIINGNILRGVIEGNIGKCYVQLGQFEKAIPYLENSIAIIEENNIGKSSTDVNENVLALAESHLKLENLKMAKDYLELDLNFSSVELVLFKNRLFASYYDKISDFEKQSFYLKKNVRIRDSLELNESDINKQQLAAFIGHEEVKASRQELNRSESQLEQARLDFKKQDERINLVLISLVFTLLGFAGLVYAYLKSIKNQRIVAEQKHIIENSLVEKDS